MHIEIIRITWRASKATDACFTLQMCNLIGLVCGLGFGRETWKILNLLAKKYNY